MSARGTITSSAVVPRSRSTLAISARSCRSSSGAWPGCCGAVGRFLHQFGDRLAHARARCRGRSQQPSAAGCEQGRRGSCTAPLMPASRGSGTPSRRRDARLRHLHPPRLAGVVVVVAAQMQRAVHHQMREMMRRRACAAAAASRRTMPSASTISPGRPGRGRVEGQHIGRLVAAAMARIQPLHRAVGGEHHGAASTRGRARRAAASGFGCAAPAGASRAPPR